ncbi:MAG: O-succinylhomoserine sulfhydrylase [Natronospirillum sp.]|uniref:O-succinylhomoserine sulfhydrylase n=1 Tax=Natronospirillum sp. TaxID=2812955 RepID=UPI0025ECD2D2|nr:O-succinylhomoserine sulfhydrylase [Natronospirillum sp.]MCH8551361.1 O-succinylhomoserine sulfhydrylase [Natronospirillum sp.]
MKWQDKGQATAAIRAGVPRSPQGEHSEALYLTSSFVFDSAAQAAARFSGEEAGNVYARYTNPTVTTFEQRLALMESTEAAVGTSSGMAAILSTCMALLQSGDHIVASRNIFGSTMVLFNKYLSKFGVDVTYVDLTDLEAWAAAMTSRTRLLFAETPSNPLNDVVDIAALAGIAHQHEAWLAIDNCFCTPALQRPAEFGADLVIHSATKFIDGQGRAMGGAVCGRAEQIDEVVGFLRSAGPTMSPFNAWIFQKGLETLALRMRAHSDHAGQIAAWLQQHPAVEKVHYCGLPEHPGHDLARKQQSGFGGVLSFVVRGGQENAWKVIDATEFLSITANLGDAKTTITHPGTTTHGRLSDEDKALAGIEPGLIRVAVGLEDPVDIQQDLARGLDTL